MPHIELYVGLPDAWGGRPLTILLDAALHIIPFVLLFLALLWFRPLQLEQSAQVLARRIRTGIGYVAGMWLCGVTLWVVEPWVVVEGCLHMPVDPNSGLGWLVLFSSISALFIARAWWRLARLRRMADVEGGVVPAQPIFAQVYMGLVVALVICVSPLLALFCLFTALHIM